MEQQISDIFSTFLGGFARIFLVSLVVWMIGLVVLLFRELFSHSELNLKEYMMKVWKFFILSFEICAYAAVIVGPILLIMTEEYMIYSMVTVAATVLSIIYFSIRKRTGGYFKERKKKKQSLRQVV